jgi:hypothetical protein
MRKPLELLPLIAKAKGALKTEKKLLKRRLIVKYLCKQ